MLRIYTTNSKGPRMQFIPENEKEGVYQKIMEICCKAVLGLNIEEKEIFKIIIFSNKINDLAKT